MVVPWRAHRRERTAARPVEAEEPARFLSCLDKPSPGSERGKVPTSSLASKDDPVALA
jgi:hypothetical protein